MGTQPKTKAGKRGQTESDSPPSMDNLPAETTIVPQTVLAPVPRPGSLATLRKVRQETSHLYRDCRVGKLDATTFAKMVYGLNILGKLCESETLESRMDRLEADFRGQQ